MKGSALTVFIGYDSREPAAYAVAESSLLCYASIPVAVRRLHLPTLEAMGLMRRPHYQLPNGQHIDEVDGRPFSTEFAFSRFLVPWLMAYEGPALFVDCDMLFRGDVAELLGLQTGHAVNVVHHDYRPAAGEKMDGLSQQAYPFKNWSSVMLFNCGHPANRHLTPAEVNSRPGRWLHSFGWLDRDLHVGELPEAWNWLVGHSLYPPDPKLVHFTEGGPWHEDPRYHNVPFADEWCAEHRRIFAADISHGGAFEKAIA